MKFIWLSVTQLKSFATKNKLIFFLFFFGMVFASLIFIYAYGNMVPSKYWLSVESPAIRTFTVWLDSERALSPEDLAVLDDYEIQDIKSAKVLPYEEMELMALRHNNAEMDMVFTELFEPEDLEGNNAITSRSYKEDVFTISGNDYKVVKKVSFMSAGAVFIPIKAFIENEVEASYIEFTLKEVPNIIKQAEMKGILEKHFEGAGIETPLGWLDGLSSQDQQAVIIIAGIYFVSMMVFFVLLKHLIAENSQEYITYAVVGASKKKVFAVILLQNIMFFLLAFTIAYVLHMVLYNVLFDAWLNFFEGLKYTAADYLLVFSITFLLTCVSLIPFIWRFTSKTINEMKSVYYL